MLLESLSMTLLKIPPEPLGLSRLSSMIQQEEEEEEEEEEEDALLPYIQIVRCRNRQWVTR